MVYSNVSLHNLQWEIISFIILLLVGQFPWSSPHLVVCVEGASETLTKSLMRIKYNRNLLQYFFIRVFEC